MFDEIKEELEILKKFNKELVDAKNEIIADKESKVMKVKIDEVNDHKEDKNDDERGSDVKNMVDNKDVIEDEDNVNKTFYNESEGDMVEKGTKSETASKCKNDEKTDDKLAPSKKEIFDAARAQEMIVENLPEPPDTEDEEIEGKLKRLKIFNEKLASNKNENVVKREFKDVKADKSVAAKSKDVKKISNEKDKEEFNMKHEATGHKE